MEGTRKRNHFNLEIFTLSIAFLMMGLLYSWSNFARQIEVEEGWSSQITSTVFTCSIISFSIGNLLGDSCCKRIGVRGSILVVAGLMGIGLIAAASAKQAWALILYYGWIWGAAVGLGYNVLLGYAAYLVPDRAGTVSGALLMLYGFGSLITGGLLTFIMGHIGWRCTFVCIGVIYCVVFCFVSRSIGSISNASSRAGCCDTTASPHTAVRTRFFWVCYFWCFTLLTGGVTFVGRAADIAMHVTSISAIVASVFVGVLSCANGVGRLIAGALFDRFDLRLLMILVAVGEALGIGFTCVAISIGSLTILMVGYILIGSTYGAVLTLGIAAMRREYGEPYYKFNMALILTSSIPSSLLGPSVASFILERTNNYIIVFSILMGLAILGSVFGAVARSKT